MGPYTYALFGSSRQLQVGPVAVLSLLTANAISAAGLVNETSPPELYAQHAFFLAFSTGLVTAACGIIRIGFILNFISDAVVTGFVSATAIVILSQQLKNIFAFPNYKWPRSEKLQDNIKYFIQGCESGPPNWYNFGFFLVNFFLLVSFRFIPRFVKKPKWAMILVRVIKYLLPLLCLMISILLVWGFKLNTKWKLPIVGKLPAGLPGVNTAFFFDSQMWKDYVSGIVTITLVGHIEAVAIARKLATRNHYILSHNMEMFSLGFMCVMGALFQSYPLTGSFSRSALNNELRAFSQLAGAITATGIVITCAFLTPLFQYTPQATLAAVVWYAVIFLVQPEEIYYVWKTSKKSFFVVLVVGVLVLFVGIEWAIGAGIVISLAFILYETQHPHTTALGRLPGSDKEYVDVFQYPEALTLPNTFIWRIDNALYYPNCHFFRHVINEFLVDGVHLAQFSNLYNSSIWAATDVLTDYEHGPEAQEKNNQRQLFIPASELKVVIVDLSAAPFIDISGAQAIRDVVEDLERVGVILLLSQPNTKAIATIERSGVMESIGRDKVFLRLEDAVAYAKAVSKGDKPSDVLYSPSGRIAQGADAPAFPDLTTQPIEEGRDFLPGQGVKSAAQFSKQNL